MKKTLFSVLFALAFNTYAQSGYLSVNAGADTTGACNQAQNLSATYTDLKETTDYVVQSTPYVPPADFTSGTTPPGLLDTDEWSTAVPIGFNFCYYGNTYSNVYVGPNGAITFTAAYAGTNSPWQLSDGGVPITLPQATDAKLSFNTIYGVTQDLYYKADGSNGTITYELIGTSPNRALVVKFNAISEFSCTAQKVSSMIVLYETTNNIDVFIKEKPVCAAWQGGYGLVGINNVDGTQAVTPPGRNTTVWNVDVNSSEAWRFTPNGASTTSFEWTDSSGTSLGNMATVSVTPSTTETYTATATYTTCDGQTIVVSDDVIITMPNGPMVDLGMDTSLCDGTPLTLDATPSNAADFNTITYLWSSGDTTATLNVTAAGTYNVTVTADGCDVTDEIIIIDGVTPNIVFANAPYDLCPGQSLTISASVDNATAADYTFTWFEQGNSTPIATTQDLTVTSTGDYVVVVTLMGGTCSSTDTVTVDASTNCDVIAEAISPNGDGMNDTFDLTWLNMQPGIKNLKIFNRYGSPVFDKDNYSNEFKGEDENGYKLPSETYFYIITLADDTIKEGWLYINN